MKSIPLNKVGIGNTVAKHASWKRHSQRLCLKYPTSTAQFERTIYTIMEKFQTHSLLAKKKTVMSELKRNWTIQALEWKQAP